MAAASPTFYPNPYYTNFGGGSGNQFKHIFIGSERILTKKTRIAPDRKHWYYHPDHLGSTAMVTNQNSQMVDAVHYFPFGEVWFEEVVAASSFLARDLKGDRVALPQVGSPHLRLNVGL